MTFTVTPKWAPNFRNINPKGFSGHTQRLLCYEGYFATLKMVLLQKKGKKNLRWLGMVPVITSTYKVK